MPRTSVVLIPRIRLAAGENFAFGPGKADLLEHVDRTGSIAEAARAMEMSYMRAWQLVKSLDESFAEPLVLKSRSGPDRGTRLTPTGRKVLEMYRAMEKESTRAAAPLVKQLEALLQV